MPELPEVETIRRTLLIHLKNKTIEDVEILRPRTIIQDPNIFKKTLIGKKITDIERRGKYLIFDLNDGLILVSHLRMEGKFYYREKTEPATPHDCVIFHFQDGSELVYNDVRHFGRMKLMEKEGCLAEPPLDKVGPDPFELKDVTTLCKAWKGKTLPLKTALLEQEVMSGLGNIYVDEILFAVRLHPETPVGLVPREKWEEILLAARKILDAAISAGGSTIRSYHPEPGKNGSFQFALKAYGHAGEPCPVCGTILTKIRVNGRGTTFCPKCQKDLSRPYVIGITGPIASGKSLAAAVLAGDDLHIFDADKAVRRLYEDHSFQRTLQAIYSEDIIVDDQVDRALLLSLILQDDERRKQLETLVHGAVKAMLLSFISAFGPKDLVVIEVPLLYEARFDENCDVVLYVDADEKTRIKRLKERGDDVKRLLKLNASLDHEGNRKRADIIIENNGTLSAYRLALKKFLSDRSLPRSDRTPGPLLP